MPIPDFDYKTFAKDLAQQAAGVIPAEISKPDKDYIVSLVMNFCNMAGEALSNDNSFNYTAENAYIITQFIGEWTFHKTIDLIHGKIPRQHRDRILQQIAFTVFEIAKQCVKKGMPQADMIKIVEAQVTKTYQKALMELQKRGALTAEQANTAARMSNLDDMSKQQPGANASDTKILKMAAFAMVLRTMPQEKAAAIIARFSEEDAVMLQEYLGMEDLEHKLDSVVVGKYLEEFKNTLPAPTKCSMKKVTKRLRKLLTSENKPIIEELVETERPLVKSFLFPTAEEQGEIQPRVADVICKYLEDKMAC